MITLSRGQPYPLQHPNHDTAVADFLRTGGNRLLIVLSGMNSREEYAFRNGMITGGFLYNEGGMLWLFRFYDNKGLPLFTFDAPFDARLIPADDRQLHSIDNAEQRLLIDLHAVDDKGILRAIRAVTLPPRLTLSFLSAVQEQLARRQARGKCCSGCNSNPNNWPK
jgi:hypothetical protein